MNVDLLSGQHPTYAAEVWARYDALYRGGEAFRACLSHFLPQNPAELYETYEARKRRAHYTGYVGPIVDWFAAKLCAASLVIRAKPPSGAPSSPNSPGAPSATETFYGAWKEDVDGAGTDLIDFLRARFTRACVVGRTWWVVEMPDDEQAPPVTRAEWERRGLGRATIAELENEQVLDFEVDRFGELVWAIVHTLETPRPDPRAPRGQIQETWRVYDRESVTSFGITYDPKEQRPTEARSLGTKPHGFQRVPLVALGFVGTRPVKVRVGGRMVRVGGAKLEGFWLLARLADPQLAHFRAGSALDWNIERTCYAMPVFHLEDEAKPPTMGAGYYIQLGVTEKADWIGPPTQHLAVLLERVAGLKDEIYRVANQLAQGVDNNAAAVGRSGESKQADAASTEVVLRVYGALVREAVERTYELIAEGRGEDLSWSIEGLEAFSLADGAAVIDAATSANKLNVPSPTFRRELLYRVAEALLPGVDQPTKDAIRIEIDAGVAAEAGAGDNDEGKGEDGDPPASKRAPASQPAPKGTDA
jgi:hypothetical protein